MGVADADAMSVLDIEDADLLIVLTDSSVPEKCIEMLTPGIKYHPDKVYSSAAMPTAFGGMVNGRLFVHAVTGCDTIRRLYTAKACVISETQEQPLPKKRRLVLCLSDTFVIIFLQYLFSIG